MNKEEAIKICEGFTICVYEKDPQFFGNMWQVKKDIRSITAVQKLLEEYKKLEEDYKNEVEENLKLSELWRKSQEEKRQLEINRDKAYKLLDDIDEYMLPEQHLKLVEAKKLLERGKE